MYQIQGKFKDHNWQVIDEAKTFEEAHEMYGKYRVAFGPEWILLVVKVSGEEEVA